jgi:hypothetical protein
MGKPLQGAVNFRRGHQLSFFDDAHVRVILSFDEKSAKRGFAARGPRSQKSKKGRGRLRGKTLQ